LQVEWCKWYKGLTLSSGLQPFRIMTKANKASKPSVAAFLTMAREYHCAANTLFPIAKDVASPIYFLYTHTVELALKAYLASHGREVEEIHNLESLCEQCQKAGLHVNCDLANVIHGLQSEIRARGFFRYFAFVSTGIPEIGYLRQVVDDLMIVIGKDIESRPSKDSDKGVVFKFIFGKPEKK
jgi:HEPN domain-containing protein